MNNRIAKKILLWASTLSANKENERISELEAQVKDLTAIHGDDTYIHIKPEHIEEVIAVLCETRAELRE